MLERRTDITFFTGFTSLYKKFVELLVSLAIDCSVVNNSFGTVLNLLSMLITRV